MTKWLSGLVLLGFVASGCGGARQPEATHQPAPMAAPTGPALAAAPGASRPAASSSAAPAPGPTTCWQIQATRDPAEATVGERFARWASQTLASLDAPRATPRVTQVARELRNFGLVRVGELCPTLGVVLTKVPDTQALSARLTIRGGDEDTPVQVTVLATIPTTASGAVLGVEDWELVEPLVDSLARALLLPRIAKVLADSEGVSRGAALAIDDGLLWGWARTADHVSQCFFLADGSRRWCWRTANQRGPGVYAETWARQHDEVRGFLRPSDGVIWAARFPAGEFARVTTTQGWPTSGFAPLPNDDLAPEVMLLPVAHERGDGGAHLTTALGPIRCRRGPRRFVCSPSS